ncbi:N-acetyltransferase ESCO1 [Protopterus annectens]|uniref:N-acetyltransferase ESCO1 n=1 Tax=Protopterus annectens TaxID=7888 RepID=UPI001CF932B3|nr:N-acetyltransferase ESCO1 [Protopterus annectens]
MPAQKRKSSLADQLVKRRRVEQKCSVMSASKKKSHCSSKSADTKQRPAHTRDSARKQSNPTRQVMSLSRKAISSCSQPSCRSKEQKQSSQIKTTLRKNPSKQLPKAKIETKKKVMKTVEKQTSKKTVRPVHKKTTKAALKKASFGQASSEDKNAVAKREKSTSDNKNCSTRAFNMKNKSSVVKHFRNSDRTALSNSRSEQVHLKQDAKNRIPKKNNVLLPTRSSLRQAIQKSQKLVSTEPASLENVPLPAKSLDKTVKEVTGAVQSTAKDVVPCQTETQTVKHHTDLSNPLAVADLSQKIEKSIIKPVERATRTENTMQNEKSRRSLSQKDGSDLLEGAQHVGKNKTSKTLPDKGLTQNSQRKCLPNKGSRSKSVPSLRASDKKSAKGVATVKLKTDPVQQKSEQDQDKGAVKTNSVKYNKTERKKKEMLDARSIKASEGDRKKKAYRKLKNVECKNESASADVKKNTKKEKVETKSCKKKSKSELLECQDQKASNKSSQKKGEQITENKQDSEPPDSRKKKVKQKLISSHNQKEKLKVSSKQKSFLESKKKLKHGTVCSAVAQVTPPEESENQLKSKQPSILELCEEIADEIESDTVEVKKDVAKVEEPKDKKEDEEKPSESDKSEIHNELPKEVGQGSQSHRFFTSKSLLILKKELIESMNRRRSKAYKDHSWSKIKHLKTSHVNHINTSNHSVSPKPGIVPKWLLSLKQDSQMVIEEMGSEAKVNTEECTANSLADGSKKVKPHKPPQDDVPDERTHYLRPAIIQLLKEFQELDEQTEESAPDANFCLRLDSSPENSPLKSSEGLSPLKQAKTVSNSASYVSRHFSINQAKSGPSTVQPESSPLKQFKRGAGNAPQEPTVPREVIKGHEHKSPVLSLPSKGKEELESTLKKSLSPKDSKTESQDVSQGPLFPRQTSRESKDALQELDDLRQTQREQEVSPPLLPLPNQVESEPKNTFQGLPQAKHNESKEEPHESSLPKQANKDSEDALQGQSAAKQIKQESDNALQKLSPVKQIKRRLDCANQELSPPKQAKKETEAAQAKQAEKDLDNLCQEPSAPKPAKSESETVSEEPISKKKAKSNVGNGQKKTPLPKETKKEVEDAIKDLSPKHMSSKVTNSNASEKTKSVPLEQHSVTKSSAMPSDASIQKEIKRLKELEDDDQQLTIDAGQKRFGPVTCSICGMLYTASNPEDETQHLLFHNQFVSAVKYVGWKKERILAEYPDGKIIMVLPDDPKYALKKVEEIREMVDNNLGFQQAPLRFPSKTKSLLFISNDKKVIGCLIAEHIHQGYRVIEESRVEENTDRDGSLFERQRAWCCSTVPEPALCGISRIWVFSVMRRMRIASRMIDCLRSNFIFGSYLGKEEIAFSDPTPDGKSFATWYCGTPQFMVYNFIS